MTFELSGKEISKAIKADLKERVEASGVTPVLAAVIFGDDEGSVMYAKSKARSAAKLGIEVEIIHYPDIVRTDKALA
ncbi:MAG: tetrahydrofolate dehydrogenase/cyclohydrolase catalytic domain-containing protein, partial [bacterium]